MLNIFSKKIFKEPINDDIENIKNNLVSMYEEVTSSFISKSDINDLSGLVDMSNMMSRVVKFLSLSTSKSALELKAHAEECKDGFLNIHNSSLNKEATIENYEDIGITLMISTSIILAINNNRVGRRLWRY